MNKKLMKNFIFVGLIALIVCANFLTALAVETYTWEEKASMGVGRVHHSSIVVNDKIYIIGGQADGNVFLNSIEMYNIADNTWVNKASMATGRQQAGVALHNNKIYVFGGITATDSYSNSVEVYDTLNDTWVSKNAMPTGRHGSRAITVDNKIYVIGGRSSNSEYLKTIEIYDPELDTWQLVSEMPNPRYGFGLATLNSKIYVAGGWLIINDVTSTHDNTINVFNTITNTWELVSNMRIGREFFGLVSSCNNLYAIGGRTNIVDDSVDVDKYDVETDNWSKVSSFKYSSFVNFGYISAGNKIYLSGGAHPGSSYSNELNMLCISGLICGSPTNLTPTSGNAQVLLNWDPVTNADTYTVKRATTQGGPYTIIAENITETSYLDTSVVNGITYYYVVTAVNTAGESDPSNEASATPIAPVVNRALLNITMHDSLIKEYDLSMTQINSFIDWYNSSTGSELYTVEKVANIRPFLSRKDYLVKGKIVCFEVMEYVNNQ